MKRYKPQIKETTDWSQVISKSFFTKLPGHNPEKGMFHYIRALLRVDPKGKKIVINSTMVKGNEYKTSEKVFPLEEYDEIISKIIKTGGVEEKQ